MVSVSVVVSMMRSKRPGARVGESVTVVVESGATVGARVEFEFDSVLLSPLPSLLLVVVFVSFAELELTGAAPEASGEGEVVDSAWATVG